MSKMMFWSVIVALSMRSILGNPTVDYDTATVHVPNSGNDNATMSNISNGNTTVDYDTATVHVPNSGNGNATISNISNGFGNSVPIPSALNAAAAVSTNASATASYLIATAAASSARSICQSQGRFFCESEGTCINANWRCDGYRDCLNNEDEQGCTARTSTLSPTTSSARDNCLRQGRFYCQTGGTCISSSWRCDGENDCLYNEDELGCTTITSTARTTVASSSSCGSTLYGSGYVRSPRYSSLYDNNLSCNWTLIASPYNGYLVLQFNDFYTESCCDFLSIYNSSGALINRYSGASVPSTVILGNAAYITFTTDSSTVYSGFEILFYTSVASATTPSPRESCERQGNFYCALSASCVPMSYRCNGYSSCYYGEDEAGCGTSTPAATTASSSSCGGALYGSGYLRSPNYPSSYYNYLSCNWTLTASPYNGNIVLQFLAFSTESCCDFLSIYHSNGTLVSRYSGTTIPSSVVLGSYAVVIFTTDGSVASSGFSISFSTSVASATTPSPRESCERQGNFYCAISAYCVPMSYRCNGYTSCYYGEDEAGCGSSTPSATTTSSSSCGSALYGSGYLRSPNYPSSYYSYLSCNWTLTASPYNGNIVLQFLAFSTESCCDFLSIYNSNGILVNRYSGTTIPSSVVLGSYAVVSFTTDGSVASSGFSISFSTSVASATTPSPRESCERQGNFYCAISQVCIPMSYRCTGTVYCTYGEDEAGCGTSTPAATTTSSSSCGGALYGSGYLRSPNYPSSYYNYLSCNWTLTANPYNGNIVLQIIAFSTESCCDFLSIYNSNGVLVNRYSGTTIPSSVVLSSYAVVIFTTDSSVASSGFSIWFSTSGSTTTTLSPRDSCEQQGYFYCALSSLCIASWRRCDGYTYCYYGEDEAGCSASSTTRMPSTTGAAPSPRDSCLRQGNFYCEFSRECIAMWRRCDGYAYCYYGEDESGCVSTSSTRGPVTGQASASEQPQGSFIAASGFAQAFLQLGKSSASELPRGSWILVSGYVTALLLGLPRFG